MPTSNIVRLVAFMKFYCSSAVPSRSQLWLAHSKRENEASALYLYTYGEVRSTETKEMCLLAGNEQYAEPRSGGHDSIARCGHCDLNHIR